MLTPHCHPCLKYCTWADCKEYSSSQLAFTFCACMEGNNSISAGGGCLYSSFKKDNRKTQDCKYTNHFYGKEMYVHHFGFVVSIILIKNISDKKLQMAPYHTFCVCLLKWPKNSQLGPTGANSAGYTSETGVTDSQWPPENWPLPSWCVATYQDAKAPWPTAKNKSAKTYNIYN